MAEDIIARARRNLTMIRSELAEAKHDLDDPRTDLGQIQMAVEIVKADAAIAQAELLLKLSTQVDQLLAGDDR